MLGQLITDAGVQIPHSPLLFNVQMPEWFIGLVCKISIHWFESNSEFNIGPWRNGRRTALRMQLHMLCGFESHRIYIVNALVV